VAPFTGWLAGPDAGLLWIFREHFITHFGNSVSPL